MASELSFLIAMLTVSSLSISHGIYCYKKETLKSFVSFDQTSNELDNKLEQLRALDNSIKINVALASASPMGVDTAEDFRAIKKIIEYKS